MNLIEVNSTDLEIGFEHFWKCLEIWITKPFFYFRRCGGLDLYLIDDDKTIDESLSYANILISKLETSQVDDYVKLKKFITEQSKSDTLNEICSTFFNIVKDGDDKICTLIRILYPKTGKFSLNNFEIITLDVRRKTVIFTKTVGGQPSSYSISYDGMKFKFSVTYEAKDNEEFKRLMNVLFTKLPLWANFQQKTEQIHSLRLVPTEPYVTLYNKLKKKYNEPILKNLF